MIEWLLFVCLLRPETQEVRCGHIVTPTEEICTLRRTEIDAQPGIIATTPCRAYENGEIVQ